MILTPCQASARLSRKQRRGRMIARLLAMAQGRASRFRPGTGGPQSRKSTRVDVVIEQKHLRHRDVSACVMVSSERRALSASNRRSAPPVLRSCGGPPWRTLRCLSTDPARVAGAERFHRALRYETYETQGRIAGASSDACVGEHAAGSVAIAIEACEIAKSVASIETDDGHAILSLPARSSGRKSRGAARFAARRCRRDTSSRRAT